jgi:hypothetical protein
VTHYATPRFWRSYRKLPQEIQRLADRSYEVLEIEPSHRSLHSRKTGPCWSVRVGLHYRALAVEAGRDLVWFWIGSHAEYDKLVGRRPANKRMQPTRGKGRSRHRTARG